MAASPSSDSVSPGPSPEGGESRLRTPGGSPAAASDGIAPLTGHWGAPAAPAWKPPHLQHSCRSRNQASGGTEAGRVVKGGREVYQAARTSASPTSAAPSLTPLLLPKCHCPQGPVCDFSSILEPRPLSSDNSRIPPSGLEPPPSARDQPPPGCWPPGSATGRKRFLLNHEPLPGVSAAVTAQPETSGRL